MEQELDQRARELARKVKLPGFRAGKVPAVGAVVYLAGLVLASTAASALGITLGLGVLVGLAMAGCTFTVILGAVGKAVPEGQRTLAFGIVTAGGSLGQFLIVPFAQQLISHFDWHAALVVLSVAVAVMRVASR